MIVECPGCRLRYDVTGRPAGTRARCRCGTVFALPEPPVVAGGLECPRCRASVAPTNHACEYCGAQLLVKACPRCFARVFHGSAHCWQCGAGVAAPAAADGAGDATPRMCPRCQTEQLQGRLVESYLLDECDRCHGVYVDAATLERLIADRRGPGTSAAATGRRTTRQMAAAPAPTPPPGAPMYVKCPDCGQLMNRRNFGRCSGVIVDVCPAHGTWFDARELPMIVEFVADGGLEEGERRDLERQKEEARQARARAMAERMRSTQYGGVHDLPGSGGDLLVGIWLSGLRL